MHNGIVSTYKNKSELFYRKNDEIRGHQVLWNKHGSNDLTMYVYTSMLNTDCEKDIKVKKKLWK